MPPAVLVVGSLHYDLMIAAPRLPLLGETLPGSSWRYKPGGKGGNQAVDAARYGLAVAMIGCVGNDEFGGVLLEHLRRSRVDTTHIATLEGETGLSVALSEAGGDYAAVIISGVNTFLNEAQIEKASSLFDGASVVVLQNEIPETINLLAARIGRRSGGKIILNAAPSRAMSDSLKALVDILVVNSLEAEGFGSCAVTDRAMALQAARMLAREFPAVIVTAGEAGVAFCSANDEGSMASHSVRLVSTHGAGDAFIGALAAEMAAGETLRRAVTRANAAAAVIVSTPDEERASLGTEQMRHRMEQLLRS
ncbi:ribokinase [Asaia prunellae]|uniref:ribokinase n=1 Tax=Asaia prunellae TaxID=610245 RepID=UPI000ABF3BC6|nr:ribokinase [Asaia prunellae]